MRDVVFATMLLKSSAKWSCQQTGNLHASSREYASTAYTEIARPIMKAIDEGAEADTVEPNAKTRKEVMKIYFMGYSVYNWPKVKTVEQPARRLEISANISESLV